MASNEEKEDNDVLLSKAVREIEQDDGFTNKGQALFERANDFLETANYRFYSIYLMAIIY